MTFWTPARTESLQAPPHWKCGGISNISHWQKDPTAGVHTHKPDSSPPFYLYISLSLSLPPINLGVARLDQKRIHFKCTLLLYHKLLHLKRYAHRRRGVGGRRKKKSQCVWLEISNSTDFPDILLYVSNQHLNANVSPARARVIGPESVCVCLTAKCLKCPLSAPLSSSLPAPLSSLWLCCWCICRRHNIRTLVLLIEPICCRLLPRSWYPLDNTLSCNSSLVPLEHLTKKMSSFDLNAPALNAFHSLCYLFPFGPESFSPFRTHE